ncbi:chorion class A protein Ld5-like [Anticarsia gemmatalis]|uniref:chorion class A protein Ld5-like n=1 Tax=Anticarsia gemmatalis TaxID=129554 RepID=UPI003F758D9B
MNTFAVVFLCVQACLVQNVFGQCAGRYGAEVINSGIGCGAAIAPAAIAPASIGCGYANGLGAGLGYANGLGAGLGYANGIGYGNGLAEYGAGYGGAGEGNVAVAGELPVAGTTALAGVVPILGAVSFGGSIPAAGAVSIRGQCSCGCGY